MLIVATAQVFANAVCEPFALDVSPYRVEVGVDDDNYWCEIKITKRVANWRDSVPDIVVYKRETPPEPSANIRPLGETPSETSSDTDDIRDLLRHLESYCGYLMDVDYVDWNCPTWEWIPESEEERAGLTCLKWDIHYAPHPKPMTVNPELLAKVVRNRPKTAYLDIPLSFFREGKADLRVRHFINAFFNFYFFMEGLYADGRSSERGVLEKYLSSTQLKRSLELTFEHFSSLTGPDDGRHALNLKVLLGELRLNWDPEGLLRLVVRMRNLLHHYSHRSRGVRQGHPLNQMEYESLAYLAEVLCINCITPLVTGDTSR
jgi:hypothetical protein